MTFSTFTFFNDYWPLNLTRVRTKNIYLPEEGSGKPGRDRFPSTDGSLCTR